MGGGSCVKTVAEGICVYATCQVPEEGAVVEGVVTPKPVRTLQTASLTDSKKSAQEHLVRVAKEDLALALHRERERCAVEGLEYNEVSHVRCGGRVAQGAVIDLLHIPTPHPHPHVLRLSCCSSWCTLLPVYRGTSCWN